MAPPSPKDLLLQLQSYTNNPPAEILDDTELRGELYHAARKLELRLEEPRNAMHRLTLAQNVFPSILKIAFDLRLFPYLAKDNTPKDFGDIAAETKADPVFVRRLLRYLAAEGVVEEVGDDGYCLSHSAGLLGDEVFIGAAQGCGDIITDVFNAIPPFMNDTAYKNPTDRRDGPCNKAFNVPNADLYELMRNKFPEKMQAFGYFLGAFAQESAKPHDVYPVQERLIDGFKDDPEEKLWIDVGGGMGFYSVAVQSAFPKFKGKFVVQEQDMMIHVARSKGADKQIEFMTHDFLNEQPVKGARAYYFRNIFHNWGDADSTKILTRIRDAMKPGYSRLLIQDLVIPERGAAQWEAAQDWLMLMGYCAHERSEAQWRELLESVGLQINKIYTKRGDIPIIEAEIAA